MAGTTSRTATALLRAKVEERYRVRQGFYRILYEIRDQELVVTVVKVGHRRDVYRN